MPHGFHRSSKKKKKRQMTLFKKMTVHLQEAVLANLCFYLLFYQQHHSIQCFQTDLHVWSESGNKHDSGTTCHKMLRAWRKESKKEKEAVRLPSADKNVHHPQAKLQAFLNLKFWPNTGGNKKIKPTSFSSVIMIFSSITAWDMKVDWDLVSQ